MASLSKISIVWIQGPMRLQMVATEVSDALSERKKRNAYRISNLVVVSVAVNMIDKATLRTFCTNQRRLLIQSYHVHFSLS